jgi:hypothetical protein
MDTHFYDGKLSASIIKDLNKISKYSDDKKKDMISMLIEKVDVNASVNMLVIMNDIGKNSNYDNTNSLNAGDLLYLCSKYSNNEDFIQELNIQLLDMNTGFCPQGRTHRLFQLLLAFDD